MAKLYFRYGAMGCGKSTALLQVAHNYEEKGADVLILKPTIDTKGNDRIESRLGVNRRAKLISKEDSFWDFINYSDEYACVLVDEAQFLTPAQVDEMHNFAATDDVPVMCYGLRTNYKLGDGGFLGATRLLQVAEDISEIKTICKCGAKATCSARYVNGHFTKEGDDILIDGVDDNVRYESLCYKCYCLADAMSDIY